MPRTSTAIKTYPLGIILSGGTSTNTATYVKATNRTTGYYRKVRASANEAVVDLCRLSSDGADSGTMANVTNGDIIDIVAYGYRYGATTHTVSLSSGSAGRRVTVTCTDVSSSNTSAVTI